MTSESISHLLPVFRRARDQLTEASELIAAIDQELTRSQIYADEAGLGAAARHTRKFTVCVQTLQDCLAELRGAESGPLTGGLLRRV